MTPDLPEVIERGAARLDAAAPDWADAVNTSRLDIRSSRDCILGQVFGNYPGAGEQLDISAAYGFSLPADYRSHSIPMVRAELGRRWVGGVERRRAARRLVAEKPLAEATLQA